MKNNLTLKAPAKINIALDVLGKRDDGYHEMRMVNHSCNLTDELELIPSNEYKLICEGLNQVEEKDNLISKAIRLLEKQTGKKANFMIKLKKSIPDQAGLGGGSADAAAAIKLALKYWDIRLSPTQIEQIALKVGADVPYCLNNKTALVEGIGEQITEISDFNPAYMLIIKPEISVCTAEAFNWIDQKDKINHPDIDRVLESIESQRYEDLKDHGGNVFLSEIEKRYPQISQIIASLYKNGAFYATMSGTGSAVIGYFKNKKDKDTAIKSLNTLNIGTIIETRASDGKEE